MHVGLCNVFYLEVGTCAERNSVNIPCDSVIHRFTPEIIYQSLVPGMMILCLSAEFLSFVAFLTTLSQLQRLLK